MTEPIHRPHPIQPPVVDKHGRVRFKENKLVTMLYEKAAAHGLDLNQITMMRHRGEVSLEDHVQLNQLMGYSINGASDLSYFPIEIIETADLMHEKGLSEAEARAQRAEECYARLQQAGIVALKGLYDGIVGPNGNSSDLDDMLAGR